MILTPAATEGLEEILKMAQEAGKPVLVEANPVEGMATMVAICDYDAGYDLGVWVGENVKNADGSPLTNFGCRTADSAPVSACEAKVLPKACKAFSRMRSSSLRSTAKRLRRSPERSPRGNFERNRRH